MIPGVHVHKGNGGGLFREDAHQEPIQRTRWTSNLWRGRARVTSSGQDMSLSCHQETMYRCAELAQMCRQRVLGSWPQLGRGFVPNLWMSRNSISFHGSLNDVFRIPCTASDTAGSCHGTLMAYQT